MAVARRDMCELTHGMAGKRHGRGMGTGCYVCIGLPRVPLYSRCDFHENGIVKDTLHPRILNEFFAAIL